MCDSGNTKSVLCGNLEEWGGEGCGNGVQEGGNTWMPMADSCSGIPEVITMYCSNYPPIKINNLKYLTDKLMFAQNLYKNVHSCFLHNYQNP